MFGKPAALLKYFLMILCVLFLSIESNPPICYAQSPTEAVEKWTANTEKNVQNLTMGVPPWKSVNKIEKAFLPIAKYLERATGFKINLRVAVDYHGLGASIEKQTIDFGIFSPNAYV